MRPAKQARPDGRDPAPTLKVTETMNEVKKCSISGVAFTLDIHAYDTLAAYLQSLEETLRDTPDGDEIIADIEARIAELILSAQDAACVVDKPLIDHIVAQMGSAQDISDRDDAPSGPHPRIPRRLYRDTANARLGGVCAGIGKYFDIDPVWVRLGIFLPLVFASFSRISILHWFGPMFGNLFVIFLICYFIMWFAVPAARSARQKLEMNGERITAGTIRKAASANNDVDRKAKPIVADVVSVFGQVVLIVLKILAGLLVFGLILTACALIIGLFAVLVGGHELFSPACLEDLTLWVPVLGIFVALIPVVLLIYVLMCLIASRKPGGKTVLAIFLLWLASIVACACTAIRSQTRLRLVDGPSAVERLMKTDVVVDGDTTTVRRLRSDHRELESIVELEPGSVHVSVPDKHIDITVERNRPASPDSVAAARAGNAAE